jgi:hypothetical protein
MDQVTTTEWLIFLGGFLLYYIIDRWLLRLSLKNLEVRIEYESEWNSKKAQDLQKIFNDHLVDHPTNVTIITKKPALTTEELEERFNKTSQAEAFNYLESTSPVRKIDRDILPIENTNSTVVTCVNAEKSFVGVNQKMCSLQVLQDKLAFDTARWEGQWIVVLHPKFSIVEIIDDNGIRRNAFKVDPEWKP